MKSKKRKKNQNSRTQQKKQEREIGGKRSDYLKRVNPEEIPLQDEPWSGV